MVKREELRKLIKEKILLYGDTDTGKTFISAKLAAFLVENDKKVIFILKKKFEGII